MILAKIFLADVLGHAPLARPRQEALPLQRHPLFALGPGEGPPQRIRLGGAHAGHVHDQLHHLLLPDDDAVGAIEGARLQGVVGGPGGAVPVAGDELGDGAALHAHAGADEGHLVGQVLEGAGAQAPGDLELGGRLQEEDALGPAFIDQVVDLRVFGVDAAEVGPHPLPLLDPVQRLRDLIEHGQGQEVDLGEAGVGHAVLVPVHDVAAGDGPRADGDHPREGAVAQHHAADVLAQAAGRAD